MDSKDNIVKISIFNNRDDHLFLFFILHNCIFFIELPNNKLDN
jgi:hypothetical protein